ncbi:bifunctional UDP-N-acetylglucosamine diphosphorylase/glucosamine-1-phosphate N-acetyltransferase GlmU [Pediococcus claussenii]|uniref:Bifunctional protein GlmU n=1 Tax=Pediococcus claussenii (strain ATCC BAA-344 / DSM 14800 / JCM 18046 / KCTC 3811 / LMG 21948 / P06) TaxID=701521 RepID=G8PEV8_PEDCP|nr:bifunctional UDP-N-acetylglucosamine diphosphorylase/glucosamine-1-phosphate N-acetyltransferase GlmU [Pediococcus claussenii]AEV94488.1 UDP-N-acetylglucosamine diphosphorylase/glucosamine-1-phosphate N-acetyltransferase [Pediococcus claussenii ATCC BAA-344]ANZ69705.1 bifunctional N-acetylglucosamine-1-phosphate uridyltransferase/glucosamine-1-phosphate acetyltransferase [Pediococcus claussenii]ANZ71522.1 bifunctional N-acetylglucosamine-1-phosphate uridyltransferase/glucosamine-1-phosphate a
MEKKFTIILAAGQGTRMKSKLYKVLHKVSGKAMVDHVLTQVEKTHMDKVVTVIGHGAEQVRELLGDRTEYALQSEQLGTGHAVLQTESLLGGEEGMTMVVSGDTPLFRAETFEELFEYHKQKGAAVTILTANADNPFSYGRIVRNNVGVVSKIVEQKDATREETEITEINTGVYCFDNKKLFAALHQVKNNNAQGEYYLPDVIGIMKNQGEIVAAYQMDDFSESMGVNDRLALSKATKVMQKRINEEHMLNGVTIIDPENTYIDYGIKIGSDTVIEPGVQLQGNTKIGEDCVIGAHSKIVDSTIEDRVTITASTVESSIMHSDSNVGPNSHLRPKSELGEFVHVGNFCEVKNATLGARTKMGHLSYVGDATLGTDINIGCGVVFVNYDGVSKYHSNVGDYSFIGSNSNVVAPIELADHSYVAAGSTITKDVEQYGMGIARARQVNKPDYFKKLPVYEAAIEAEKNQKN